MTAQRMHACDSINLVSNRSTAHLQSIGRSVIPRLHDRANIEQTSSRPDGIPLLVQM